jgi:hypothetical protein
LSSSFFTPLNYGRLLPGKANSLLHHVIAEASLKSASMTHFNPAHFNPAHFKLAHFNLPYCTDQNR